MAIDHLLQASTLATSPCVLLPVTRDQPPVRKQKGPGRRDRADPDSWARNKSRIRRAQGQDYISSRGVHVPAAKIGPKCTCPKKMYGWCLHA